MKARPAAQALDEAECTTATTFTRHDQRFTSLADLRGESMYDLLALGLGGIVDLCGTT
jgi:hypothetical protein